MLVDNQRIIREGLRTMLEIENDFRVVGEATNAGDVLPRVGELSPEVVIMEIDMPGGNGISLTREMKKEYPDTNVLMLTLDGNYFTQAIEAGASGYMSKDIEREELIRAIRAIHGGRSTLNLSVNRDQLQDLIYRADGQRSIFSDREIQILRLIADGDKTKEIADKMFLSQATIKRTIGLIFEKLDAHNRTGAVAEAYRRALI
jgi:DNA-binding NarL/FixJ family response regulator